MTCPNSAKKKKTLDVILRRAEQIEIQRMFCLMFRTSCFSSDTKTVIAREFAPAQKEKGEGYNQTTERKRHPWTDPDTAKAGGIHESTQ